MKRPILLIFLTLLLIPSSLCHALEWKALHEKADIIDLAQAVMEIKKNPESPAAWYLQGLAYLNRYETLKAQDAFDKALSLDPESFEARWGLAEVFRRLYRIEESKTILEQITASHPKYAPAFVSLAYISYLEMDFNRSARLAKHVINLGAGNADKSNYSRAYGLYAGAKGMIAHYGGPLSKVINGTAVLSSLRKAERIDPDSPAVLLGLGSYYLFVPTFLGRDFEKAESYLKRAVKEDPSFASGYVRLAQLYRALGKEDLYAQYMKKALELDPQNIIALDVQSGACKFVCLK